MKRHNKEYIKLAALVFMFGVFLLLVYTMILGYTDPNGEVVIAINDYGEANVELFVICPIIGLLTIAAIYITAKDIIRMKGGKQ